MSEPTLTGAGLRAEVVEFLRAMMAKGLPHDQLNAASMLLKLAEYLEGEELDKEFFAEVEAHE